MTSRQAVRVAASFILKSEQEDVRASGKIDGFGRLKKSVEDDVTASSRTGRVVHFGKVEKTKTTFR